LASGKKLTVKEGTTLEISLPMAAPDKIATVIKVVLN
jgi:hypothetical protein